MKSRHYNFSSFTNISENYFQKIHNPKLQLHHMVGYVICLLTSCDLLLVSVASHDVFVFVLAML